jgi:hypothetical protein
MPKRGECVPSIPAERQAQETGRQQVATSESVVVHHGREGGGDARDEARLSAQRIVVQLRAPEGVRERSSRATDKPVCCNALLGGT